MPSTPIETHARRFAADQLGVADDASASEVRNAFLRQLPGSGFLPTPPLCTALTAMTGQSTPGATDTSGEVDSDVLQAQVASFAAQFWSLEPSARRARWQELLDAAIDDPPVAGRLRRLEAGVDLRDQASGAGPPRLREVAGMIQSLFVLAPIERASRRRELLDNLPPPASAWEETARQIQRQQPALAALEPGLVDRMSHWRRSRKTAAAAISRTAASWSFQTQGGLQIPQVCKPVVRPTARISPSWIVFLAIGLILGLLRAVSGPTRVEPRYGTTAPPHHSARSIPLMPTNWPTNNSEYMLEPDLSERLRQRPGMSIHFAPGNDSSSAPIAAPPTHRRPP